MPFLNPLKQTLCPFCVQEFHLSEAPIVLWPSKTILPSKTFSGPLNQVNILQRFYISSLNGTAHAGEIPYRSCPHCSAILPKNIDETSNQFIAILGSSRAGKSHFLAMLIHQLLNTTILESVGCEPLTFATEETNQLYLEDYYNPLIIHHQALTRTTEKPPLVYQLTRRGQVKALTQQMNFIFYDIAGEELNDARTMQLNERYIRHASGIIFLIDPLQIPAIQSRLPNIEPGDYTIDPTNTPLNIINRIQLQGISVPSSIPAAFVLSKIDMLHQARPTPQPILGVSTPLNREGIHAGGFNAADQREVESEVIRLLEYFDNAALVRQAKSTFQKVSFFGVSATGELPTAGHYENIHPLRIADPFLWILHQIGVIKAASSSPSIL